MSMRPPQLVLSPHGEEKSLRGEYKTEKVKETKRQTDKSRSTTAQATASVEATTAASQVHCITPEIMLRNPVEI
eukprot:3289498-Amphidinium_carterae.1